MRYIMLIIKRLALIIPCFCTIALNALTLELPFTATIPKENVYTGCGGDNQAPAIKWRDLPPDTKSLALIAHDPDAPRGDFIHWVMFNIAPQKSPTSPSHGTNDFGNRRYDGPCPPSGTHRYIFDLYALDTILELPEGIKTSDLKQAMKGHTLATASQQALYP